MSGASSRSCKAQGSKTLIDAGFTLMIMRHAGRESCFAKPAKEPVAFCRLFDGSTLKTCKSKPRKQRQRHDQSVVWVYFTGDEYATGALCRAASVSGLSKKSMQCIAFHCRFGRKRGVRPWAQQLSPARRGWAGRWAGFIWRGERAAKRYHSLAGTGCEYPFSTSEGKTRSRLKCRTHWRLRSSARPMRRRTLSRSTSFRAPAVFSIEARKPRS